MFYITIHRSDNNEIIEEHYCNDLTVLFSAEFIRQMPRLRTDEIYEAEGWDWGNIEDVTIRIEKE